MLWYIYFKHNMSIFKFYTDKNLNVGLENHDDLRMLSYLLMCPKDKQHVLLAFADKKVVRLQKDSKQQGLKNPIVRWMKENDVVEWNDYEFQSWPLYMCVVEKQNHLLITRNEMLVSFYKDMKGVAKGLSDFLIVLDHEYTARFYAYWILKGNPKEMEFILAELQELFEVKPANYKSYNLFENKILFRVRDRLAKVDIEMIYRREPINYGKKMVFQMQIAK